MGTSGWFTPRELQELLDQSSLNFGIGMGTPGRVECAAGMNLEGLCKSVLL